MNTRLKPLVQALGATLVLTLAACGGGGGDSTPVAADSSSAPPTTPPMATTPAVATPPAPVPIALTGTVVVDGAIRNAVVCMDLNANNACDTGEPVSAATGTDGAYSITYDSTKITAAQVAGASLIAPMVPGAITAAATTIDAADPTSGNTAKPYVLRQLPGMAGQINPLTTLVASGVSDGMSVADARANAAMQLKIAEAKIDNYQDDPVITGSYVQDSARLMAQAVKSAMEDGATLRVGNQSAAIEAAATDMATLRYTDSGNYMLRYFSRVAKAAGVTGAPTLDVRTGKTAGGPTPDALLYNFAYLTPKGWVRCNGAWETTTGTPSRSTYCGASDSVGYTVASSVGGRTISAVVTEMQADPASNVINSGLDATNLLSDLGTAVFPAGSAINARRNLALSPAISINSLNTDGRPQTEAITLEQLALAKPASGVALPSPNGSLTLGLGTGNLRNLRVAFMGTTTPTTGNVQYYECDLDSTQSVAANCAATTTGTYSIDSVNGTRVMRFAGHGPGVATFDNVYVEVHNSPAIVEGNWVYRARESKGDFRSAFGLQRRLNSTAWGAIKTQLGL